ncbi:MAG: (2Fe-2S)-binding protein [Bacilli bacterium]|nr:(2Fe-2S)-binding protein [Bacilli bacterium]
MKEFMITINGFPYITNSEETILDTCKKHNIFIPTFCHDERFTSDGSCRMCVVEVNGQKKLQTSCTLYPQEGMVINTLSEDVVIARREILKMIWSKHKGECEDCDSSGNCKLELYLQKYDIPKERAYKLKDSKKSTNENPYFTLESGKCILCNMCINICTTIEGGNAISLEGEQNNPYITFRFEDGKDYAQCLTCGECIEICPTGAIKSKNK